MAAKKKEFVYLRAMRLVDPKTGAEVSAFVPAGEGDHNHLREKGLKIGGLYRAAITRPRNYEFHKLAHRLADLCRQNLDDFHGLGTHEALKKLQQDAQVECDITVTKVPGFGTLHSVQPRSIAFDAMDQQAFWALVRRICDHISKTYWPQCTPEQIEDMIKVMPGVD